MKKLILVASVIIGATIWTISSFPAVKNVLNNTSVDQTATENEQETKDGIVNDSDKTTESPTQEEDEQESPTEVRSFIGSRVEVSTSTQGSIDLERFGLKTDSSKTLIDSNLIFNGGPGKDGIPSINDPKFESISDSQEWLTEDNEGITLKDGDSGKFYPFDILVYHEIANDTVDGREVAVTFCPLCGSSIVYDRNIDSGVVDFGVSGLLYESNLLMYDSDSESLWSQIEGRAVVGDKAGEELEILDADVMTISEFESRYSDGQVLSRDTGHSRDYGRVVYPGYDTSDDLVFDVSRFNDDLQPKTIMYATTIDDTPISVVFSELKALGETEIQAGDKLITLTYKDGEVDVTDQDGNSYPGYFTMWFSWANHNLE